MNQLRRQSKIETYTYRDFTKVRLDNCDDTNEDNDGGGGGGAMRGTASSKTKKASAFRVTDKLDAMLRDPGKQHSVVDGSRCIHGTPSRPLLSSPPLSLPISFARNRRCRISNSPSLFSSAHKRNESTKNKTVNEMPKRAGDDPRLDAPRQIVEGAESRAIHGLCPPEVLRPRQLPQLRSLSQCLVSGASPRASLSVLFFVIVLQKTTSHCFAHLFMHVSASIGGAILAYRHRLHIIYNRNENNMERTQGIPPHLLGSRHRFLLPRGAAT